jgi:2-polyprenyl-6-hydroxyphenyl methylase/3-demethylubiquinone-9 3-methyltransferase
MTRLTNAKIGTNGTRGGDNWKNEVEAGERFCFGQNWKAFLRLLDDRRIESAEDSLRKMLSIETLKQKSFLDAGSGSGLFSLAARRLGATVHSFDFDTQSVACTAELKRRYFANDEGWTVSEASVLDRKFLSRLGTYDVVYSWGVLHHTGSMWEALDNVASLVDAGGTLFVAIYNDQGRSSSRWSRVKRLYAKMPSAFRWAVLGLAFVRLWAPTLMRDAIRLRPFASWKRYARQSGSRGMSPWFDLVDWVGGYPFEVAKPEEVLDFCRARGFQLTKLKTCGGGLGCNEYVFVRLVKG